MIKSSLPINKSVLLQIYIFLSIILVIFSIPIKSLIGIGHEITVALTYTIFELILLYNVVLIYINDRNFFLKCDIPILIYFFYGIFMFIYSLIFSSNIMNIIHQFRIYYLPCVIYFAIKYIYIYTNIKIISKLYVLFILLTLYTYFEYISLNYLDINLAIYPWIEYINMLRADAALPTFSKGTRLIGIFTYLHPMALIIMMGYLMSLYYYLQNNHKIHLLVIILTLFSLIIICRSKSVLVTSVILTYLMLRSYNKINFKTFIFIINVFAVFFLYSLFENYTINYYLKYFFIIFDKIEFSIDIYPQTNSTLLNIILALFGVGLDLPYWQKEVINYKYNLLNMEWRIVTLFFKFGWLILIPYLLIIYKIYKFKFNHYDQLGYLSKLICIGILISSFHYVLLYFNSITELFFLFYGIMIYNKKQVAITYKIINITK